MSALTITPCSHRFGAVQALDRVALSVKPGELFGLIGPDGAGKTTLIRSILGLLNPDEGTFTVLGEDRVKNPLVIKDQVGYLSQQFSLYEDMTVNENIDFFAAIHGVTDHESRKRELLAFTRMSEFGNRLAGQLSGGMKQKLALACTLIHHPSLIILDEPTTGVDPISRRDFWKILSDLIRQGLTILVATPYMDEAERCHRVALMNQGSLLAVASPEMLRRQLNRKLLEMIPNDPRRLQSVLQTYFSEYESHLLGERVQLLLPTDEDPLPLISRVESHQITISHWRETDSALIPSMNSRSASRP